MQTTSFAQTKISCVGNSITEGFSLDWNNGERGWPEQLANKLGNSYKVVNCGRSGDTMLRNIKWGDGGNRSYWGTTDHGYGQAKNERPDIVIIALGTNDAGGDVWNSDQAKAGYGSSYNFMKDYTEMINEFKAINGNVKVYICLPPTIYADNQNKMDGWHNQNLENVLMPIIRQVAYNTGATLIDLHTPTANHRNDLYNDDLHPNQKGQTLLTETIYNVITKVAPQIITYGEDKYGWKQLTDLTITAGEKFSLGPKATVDGSWSWTGPNGFTSNEREITFENATTQQSGEYVVTLNANGQQYKATMKVNVLSSAAPRILPYVSGDGGNTWPQAADLLVNQGATVKAGPQASVEGGDFHPYSEGSWYWTGPDNFVFYDREFTINNIQNANSGTYTATFIDKNGRRVVESFNLIFSDPNAPTPVITPYMSIDGGAKWDQTNSLTVEIGSNFSIAPKADQDGFWRWTGPNGFTSNQPQIDITNVTAAKLGNYVLTFTSSRGKQTVETFKVTSDAVAGNTPEIPASGKVAYRLVSGNKSLFATIEKNFQDDGISDLGNGKNVVLWDETDVAAQQWFKVDNGDGRFRLKNVYTGLFLTNGQKQTSDKNDNNALFNIPGNSVNINGTNYILEEVVAQDEFTPELRDRVSAGFLAQFLQDKGGTFTTICNGGWSESESLEVLLDAYETTRNPQYITLFNQCYAYFKDKVGDVWNQGLLPGKDGYGWFGYDFNDDVMWHIILAARGYKLTGNKTYLEDAKRNFDLIWNRSYLGYVGLLRWAEAEGRDRNETNSCVNGPAEVAACYIAEGYADLGDTNTANTYWDRAKTLYSNQRIYLSDMSTGEVYDNVKFNGETTNVRSQNKWTSSYNQGTMLGAATLLHKHFGDNQYKNDARIIYDFTVGNTNKEGLVDKNRIIQCCEGMGNDDLIGFKGILMRYVRNYYEHFGDEDAREFLVRNAYQVYNTRNTREFGLTNWRIKSPENFQYDGKDYRNKPFSAITMMSAAVNTPIFLPTGESKEFEVENMTLSGDAARQSDNRASGGAYVNGIGNNANNKASFNYDAPAAGKYAVDVYYISGQRRKIEVSANGKSVAVACCSNGSWDGYAVTPIRLLIDLNAGQNTITLGNNNAWGPNLDKVVVSPATDVTTALPVRAGGVLEAEDAEIGGNAHIEYSPYASRHIGVGNIGNGQNSVTFRYNAPTDGDYEIDVHYSSGLDRDMFTQVNGGEQKLESYPRASNNDGYPWDYSAQSVKTLKVQLKAGENTIKFGNTQNGQYAPDLDYIVVRSLIDLSGIQEVPTAEAEAQAKQSKTSVYNLNGQVVSTTKPGSIYIRNGRKFIAR